MNVKSQQIPRNVRELITKVVLASSSDTQPNLPRTSDAPAEEAKSTPKVKADRGGVVGGVAPVVGKPGDQQEAKGPGKEVPRLRGGRHEPGTRVVTGKRPAPNSDLSSPSVRRDTHGYYQSTNPRIVKVRDRVEIVHTVSRAQHLNNNRLLFQIAKRARNGLKAVSDVTSIPFATAHYMRGSPIFESFSTDENGRNVHHISGHMLLSDLTAVSSDQFQRILSLPLSPGMLGGYLGNQSESNDYFLFDKSIMSFIPVLQPGNGFAVGTLSAWYAPNNDYVATGNSFGTLQIASNFPSMVETPVWWPLECDADLSGSLPMYGCQLNSDALSAFQGSFHFGMLDTIGGENQLSLGEIFITFSCKLVQQRIDPSISLFRQGSYQTQTLSGSSGSNGFNVVWAPSAVIGGPHALPLIAPIDGPDISAFAAVVGSITFQQGVQGPAFGTGFDNWMSPSSTDTLSLTFGTTLYLRSFRIDPGSGFGTTVMFFFADLASMETAKLVTSVGDGGIAFWSCANAMSYTSDWVSLGSPSTITSIVSWAPATDALGL